MYSGGSVSLSWIHLAFIVMAVIVNPISTHIDVNDVPLQFIIN